MFPTNETNNVTANFAQVLQRIKTLEDELRKLKRIEVPKRSTFGSWQSYTPTFTGFSVDPSNVIAHYFRVGGFCHVSVYMGTAGTSNATSFTMSTPITSLDVAGTMVYSNSLAYYQDNGGNVYGSGRVYITDNSAILVLNTSAVAWTASGDKKAHFQIAYEV